MIDDWLFPGGEGGMLGALEADASGTELVQSPPTNGTKRSLSVIEKVVIAGFIVNLFGIGWNVYRGMKQDEAAERARRAAAGA